MATAPELLVVRTPALAIACEAHGDARGAPVVLLHGFPDDVRAYDGVVPPLVAAGHRVIVPYLRGYGPTRFLDPSAPRMAQQAAIGQDLLDLMTALDLGPAVLAGYDWGGRAACIASLLAPERVRGLVTIGGYNVQNTVRPSGPADAAQERAFWYQWYFNTERGRAGLAANRRDICRLLWREWSPSWRFDDAYFERTAPAFDNPDFVEVVIHSYRHRHGNAPGDPRFDAGGAAARGAAGHHRAVHHPARGRRHRRSRAAHGGAPAAVSRRNASGAWCRAPGTSSRTRSRRRSPRRCSSSRRGADSGASPMRAVLVALALLVFPAGSGTALGQQAGAVSELIRAQTELIARTREYRESLEPVLGFQEAEAARAEAQARSHRELLDRGLVARREVEALDALAQAARARVDETRQRMGEADALMGETLAAIEVAKMPRAAPGGDRSRRPR